jgi:hypothetical protein
VERGPDADPPLSAEAPASGIHVDVERAGATLLIAFGGLRGKVAGMPVFEFFSLVEREDLRAKRIFVRDLRQAWYQRGVDGAGQTVPEVAARLRELAGTSGAGRVVTVGASAGGFGAILFGALIGATEVHAFSPQTFVDRRHRVLFLERRFAREIASLRAAPPPDERFMDLKAVLASVVPGAARCVIHYPAFNLRDSLHARRMGALPNVELRPYRMRAHNVIGRLRDDGRLPALLETIVSGP